MADDNVDFDSLKLWKRPELVSFLNVRGVKTAGRRKEELLALVYGALEWKLPVLPSATEEKNKKAADYRALLKTPDEGTLFDPLEKKDGWQSYRDGVHRWPAITISDITIFLTDTNVDIRDRLLKDYKNQKAYSYLKSNFTGETLYHPITESSKYCYLKSSCMQSQRVTSDPHKVWVLAEKGDSGKVVAAYCTCMAGLGSTCNHVAAILFEVEEAWKKGYTAFSKTSREREWGVPGKKKKMEPKLVTEMQFRKPHYRKDGDEQHINPPARRLFDPTDSQRKSSSSRPPNLLDLANSLYPSNKDAAAFRYLDLDGPAYSPASDFNVQVELEVYTSDPIPEPLQVLASRYTKASQLVKNLPTYTKEQINQIEEITKGQADNPLWKSHRVGVITSSVCHAVKTQFTSLQSSAAQHTLKSICGQAKALDHVAAIKYGRSMESVARGEYVQLMHKKHKNFNVHTCGLILYQNAAYMGASPDGLVSCGCCGKGLLEIKCPYSLVKQQKKPSELPYLRDINGKLSLKTSHSYYSQITWQLGICNLPYCDLFIKSPKKDDNVIVRINFDQLVWEQLKSAACTFFCKLVAPYLVRGETLMTSEDAVVTTQAPPSDMGDEVVRIVIESETITETLPPGTSKRRSCRKRKLTTFAPVYLCPICKEGCKTAEEITKEEENSVCCDKCENWFHWGCINSELLGKDWFCEDCK